VGLAQPPGDLGVAVVRCAPCVQQGRLIPGDPAGARRIDSSATMSTSSGSARPRPAVAERRLDYRRLDCGRLAASGGALRCTSPVLAMRARTRCLKIFWVGIVSASFSFGAATGLTLSRLAGEGRTSRPGEASSPLPLRSRRRERRSEVRRGTRRAGRIPGVPASGNIRLGPNRSTWQGRVSSDHKAPRQGRCGLAPLGFVERVADGVGMGSQRAR
jgi:hypothetical protein